MEGRFGDFVVATGGEWIVAAMTSGRNMWDQPNGVVRIHLATKRLFTLSIPAADTFQPLAWVDAHNRVFLYQQKESPANDPTVYPPKCFLLDPTTGEYQRIEGEVRPLLDHREKPLQRTGRKDEFWATLHADRFEPRVRSTTIGRFNAREFRFEPVLTLEDVQFPSGSLHVDEETKSAWVAVNGDLVRFTLPD